MWSASIKWAKEVQSIKKSEQSLRCYLNLMLTEYFAIIDPRII